MNREKFMQKVTERLEEIGFEANRLLRERNVLVDLRTRAATGENVDLLKLKADQAGVEFPRDEAYEPAAAAAEAVPF